MAILKNLNIKGVWMFWYFYCFFRNSMWVYTKFWCLQWKTAMFIVLRINEKRFTSRDVSKQLTVCVCVLWQTSCNCTSVVNLKYMLYSDGTKAKKNNLTNPPHKVQGEELTIVNMCAFIVSDVESLHQVQSEDLTLFADLSSNSNSLHRELSAKTCWPWM